MTEIIIRAHYALEKDPTLRRMTKSSDDFDIEIGGKKYEIKTCINGSYYNTRVNNEKGIILVASDGVYYLPKDKKDEYINEKGKLPYKNVDANHYTKIERLLGYEED
jgi:exopolysaccharide biosynthesis protein